MSDLAPAPTDAYGQGFEAGLVAGYRAGYSAQPFPGGTPPASNKRRMLAWLTLGTGLAGAAGILLARTKKGDGDLAAAVLIASSITGAFIGAIQVLNTPDPFTR
jgi:hypothetical protein